MSCRRHLRIVLLAAWVFPFGLTVRAAEFPDSPGGSRRPSGASSWITEVLAADLPKYVPHASDETVVVTQSTEAAVERDGVLSLPKMSVRPVMKESPSDFAWLTAKGRMELALKTHPGLRIGNLFGLNNGIALYMQMEEQEVKTKAALFHRVERVLMDDSADSRETLRMLESALGRANADWLKKYPDR